VAKAYRFRVKGAKGDGFFWDFAAPNNEIVCASQVYTTKEACEKGLEVIRKQAGLAEVRDKTDKAPKDLPALS
jgi:uncharacterized protein YegP (UPF0339 family)